MTPLLLIAQITAIKVQIEQLRAEITPAQVAMIDWTPYDVLNRVIPISEDTTNEQ